MAMRTINGIRYRPEDVDRFQPAFDKGMRGRNRAKRAPNKGRATVKTAVEAKQVDTEE